MPTPAATRTEITIATVETPVAQCSNSRTTIEAPRPRRMPSTPPTRHKKTASTRKLLQDVMPPGADGHPQADLAGPLRDGNQHDVHDPHPAHDERYRRHGHEQRPHQFGRPRYHVDHLGRVDNLEIVVLAILKMMPFAEQTGDLINGHRHLLGTDGLGLNKVDAQLPPPLAACRPTARPIPADRAARPRHTGCSRY